MPRAIAEEPPQPDPPAAPWAKGDACLVVPDGPATVLDGVIHDGYLWVKYPGNRNKFEVHLSQLKPPASLQPMGKRTRSR